MKYITKRSYKKSKKSKKNKKNKKGSKRSYLLCKKYILKGGVGSTSLTPTSVPSNVTLPMMIDTNQKVYSCTLIPGQ